MFRQFSISFSKSAPRSSPVLHPPGSSTSWSPPPSGQKWLCRDSRRLICSNFWHALHASQPQTVVLRPQKLLEGVWVVQGTRGVQLSTKAPSRKIWWHPMPSSGHPPKSAKEGKVCQRRRFSRFSDGHFYLPEFRKLPHF